MIDQGAKAKVGLIFILAAVVLASMIVWKGDVLLKVRGYELIGSFTDVGGIIEGSEIRYRGYKVGKVIKVFPEIKDTKVVLQISSNTKFPKGSTLRVAFDGLVGQKYLEIIPVISTEVLKPGDTIIGYRTLGLVDFIDTGTINLQEMEQILKSIRHITDDPEIQRSTRETLINTEALTGQLNLLATQMNKTFSSGAINELIENLRTASKLIEQMSKRLDAVAKSIEEFTTDPELRGDIKSGITEAKNAMIEVKNAASDVRKTVKKMVW